MKKLVVLFLAALASCGGDDDKGPGGTLQTNTDGTYGSAFTGGVYNLGPVDYSRK